ncbi:MAG: acetyl-CoA carboxylase carboxyltransferase subunit alpha [Oscillospiraceae bacterium]|jgi:acetyl-CoA carboxylase carboxyl transferase subunit alpha|nr:acetyl-CoA carboxylase carboxyltransferase subunit alpha [Oscillospiraceae bacterium]
MDTLLLSRRDRYSAKERVDLARAATRPNVRDYIDALFDNFFEIHGDRAYADDKAVVCGIASFGGIPVTVAGHLKGHDLTENIRSSFGMPNPEGYRKFIRAAEQAEKFERPVITFIDTPGAYPGAGAEERGQGEAIARCLWTLSNLRTPIISIITGEGGSGGALALGVADRIVMLENSIFSILSPEGFATILWKDAKRSGEACEVMKLTAFDLYDYNVCDRIVSEPDGGAGKNPKAVYNELRLVLGEELHALTKMRSDTLVQKRYKKFRSIGNQTGR